MIIAAVIFIICILLIASLIIHVPLWKWQADVQTYYGRKKLYRLCYEQLVLERYRVKEYRRGFYAESDYSQIPLDSADRPQHMEKFSVNGLVRTIKQMRGLGGSSFFTPDIPFDELRLYGVKDGARHLVFKYPCFQDNLDSLKSFVVLYNSHGAAAFTAPET